jgi:hypothetical protein
VRVEREILDAKMLSGLVVSKVVEQDGAQNRALRLHIRRQRADRVIGSGQGIFSQKALVAESRTYSRPGCECECAMLGKLSRMQFFSIDLEAAFSVGEENTNIKREWSRLRDFESRQLETQAGS